MSALELVFFAVFWFICLGRLDELLSDISTSDQLPEGDDDDASFFH
jgi:hypothetical protein